MISVQNCLFQNETNYSGDGRIGRRLFTSLSREGPVSGVILPWFNGQFRKDRLG